MQSVGPMLLVPVIIGTPPVPCQIQSEKAVRTEYVMAPGQESAGWLLPDTETHVAREPANADRSFARPACRDSVRPGGGCSR